MHLIHPAVAFKGDATVIRGVPHGGGTARLRRNLRSAALWGGHSWLPPPFRRREPAGTRQLRAGRFVGHALACHPSEARTQFVAPRKKREFSNTGHRFLWRVLFGSSSERSHFLSEYSEKGTLPKRSRLRWR